MVDEKNPFIPQVRVSQEIYLWLRNKAAQERRSMSQQLIVELERLAKENNNGSPE